ncbi:MAG: flagellar motor switch phosphatase FliY, partial [Bacillota bacterium]|nr:flagellar motor switch phosphatase FliY [Bacillota bacterium]
MDNTMLSQEEIDALLKGDGNFDSPPKPTVEISDIEKDAIGEIANISMGTAATTLSTLLGKKVQITTPRVSVIHRDELSAEHPLPFVAVDVQYKDGLDGNSLLVIKQEDASIIVDLMMGGSGQASPGELNELHLSAIGEAMNQMMGSAATSLSTVLNERIDISPPNVNLVNFGEEKLEEKVSTIAENLVCVSFRIVIGSLMDSEMMQLMPVPVATNMVQKLLGEMNAESATPEPSAKPPATRQGVSQAYNDNYNLMNSFSSEPKTQPMSKDVTVKAAQFAPLTASQTEKEPSNIDL